MDWLRPIRVGAICILGVAAVCGGQSVASGSGALPSAAGTSSSSDVVPLPDIATMMQQVEEHQKASEATIRNYTYTSTIELLKVDGRGDTKRDTKTKAEIFYIDGVRLRRMVEMDGKPLSADEQRKESERIDREIAKAKEKRASGGAERHRDEISFARFLELGSFSNERRVMLRGRSTIALDYTGDPKAKTRNLSEAAVHDMTGTVWVDEQDRAVSRVEGRFLNTFKVAGGLAAYVAKDTSFAADSAPINGEVWLPTTFTSQGSMHVLLFISFQGRMTGSNTNYRRFKTNSKIVEGVREVEEPPSGDRTGTNSQGPIRPQ